MGIDLFGPLKKTAVGYIFTATDFFTKLTEAFPIPSKNAKEVAKCIMKRLRTFLNGHPEKWDNFLDAALWSMRLKQQAMTKFLPLKVLYGREPRFPIKLEDLPETLEINKLLPSKGDIDAHMDHFQAANVKLYEKLCSNVAVAQSKQKEADRKEMLSKQPDLKVGSKVLVSNIGIKSQKGRKLEQRYSGPAKYPFAMMGIDLFGPLKRTADRNTYIFTATDFFTKLTEAFPIPSKNAKEVGKCIMKLFFHHGACHAFLLDNGGEFVNEISKLLPSKGDIHAHMDRFQAANVKLYEKLCSNVAVAQSKQKEADRKKILSKQPDLKVGSKVLVSNIGIKSQKGRKLEQRYSSPVRISEIQGNRFFLVDMEGNVLKKPVHKTRLKLYKEQKGNGAFPSPIGARIVKDEDVRCGRMFFKSVEKNSRGPIVAHDDRQVVRDMTKARHVFDAFHDSLMGVHTDTTKTCTAIAARYYCPATDFFTKLMEAFPIPSKNAKEIAKCIMKLFFHHSACHAFLLDNGGEFVNELEGQNVFSLDRGILVNRFSLTEAFPIPSKNAKEVAKCIMKLFFHGACHAFLLDNEGEFVNEISKLLPSKGDIDAHMDRFQAANVKLYEKLCSNVAVVQSKQKEAKRKKILSKQPDLKVGSKVLVSNIGIKSQKRRKLEQRYSGPVRISEIQGNRFFLADMEGNVLKKPVHKTRLKLYKEQKGNGAFPSPIGARIVKDEDVRCKNKFCLLILHKTAGKFRRRLHTFLNGHPEKWDEFLDAALWSMRLKQQAMTKFLPLKVLYGREPRFPIELEDLPETLEISKLLPSKGDIDAHMDRFQAANVKLYEKLCSNVAVVQSKQKEAKRKKILSKQPDLKVGSKVLVSNIGIKSQEGRKLEQRYSGPVRISEIQGNRFFLADMEGNVLKKPVHKTRLKLYKEQKGNGAFPSSIGARIVKDEDVPYNRTLEVQRRKHSRNETYTFILKKAAVHFLWFGYYWFRHFSDSAEVVDSWKCNLHNMGPQRRKHKTFFEIGLEIITQKYRTELHKNDELRDSYKDVNWSQRQSGDNAVTMIIYLAKRKVVYVDQMGASALELRNMEETGVNIIAVTNIR
eukprot:gene3899-15215_t